MTSASKRFQLGEQHLLAPQVARLEERRADRQVRLGLAQAFVDRARRLADLEPEIPQEIEQVFDDLLGVRRLLVGQQEQQIDVGIGRQLAAAIAADRDERHPFARGRVGERIDPVGDEVVEHADQLIDQKALLAHDAQRRAIPRSGGGSRRAHGRARALRGGSSSRRSAPARGRSRLRQRRGEARRSMMSRCRGIGLIYLSAGYLFAGGAPVPVGLVSPAAAVAPRDMLTRARNCTAIARAGRSF